MADGTINQQRSQESAERAEIIFLASHVLGALSRIEQQHPFLAENLAYIACKMAILDEEDNPSESTEVLSGIYDEMMEALRLISAERNSVAVIGKGQHLHLPNFLPATFNDLVNNFKVVRGPEVIEDAIESAAEEILFGTHEQGISGVVNYLPKVKERVRKLLIYDDGEKAQIDNTIDEFSEAETFRLLHLDDHALEAIVLSEKHENSEHSTVGNIAHIILAARDQIHHEHGRPSAMVHTEDRTGLAEILTAGKHAAAPARRTRHLRVV